MKTFTIENDSNNITAHLTPAEAQSVTGAEQFASAAELTRLAAGWPSARLIGIWNTLPGVTPVAKFTSRKTAVTRIWNAVQSLGETAAVKAAAANTARHRATPRPAVRASRGKAAPEATRRKKAPQTAPEAKGARAGSKSAKILGLLKRSGGASLDQLMKATGWQAHSVRGFLSAAVGKKMGLTVVSVKTEQGERRYSIGA